MPAVGAPEVPVVLIDHRHKLTVKYTVGAANEAWHFETRFFGPRLVFRDRILNVRQKPGEGAPPSFCLADRPTQRSFPPATLGLDS
jgi:hypothetical protein